MEHAYSFLWSILYLQQTNILCYEVFECNDIREIIAAHFLKKVRWWKYFLTNYTEHNMNLEVKETWRNLLLMISSQQKKGLKRKVHFCFFLL